MQAILQSQYRASLAMLKECIDKCDGALWLDGGYKHPFWRVAFHTLFFAHLYMTPEVKQFKPWEKHVDELEALGPMRHKGGKIPKEGPPYAKQDIQEYWTLVSEKIEPLLQQLQPDAPSGFGWYPVNRLEMHLINIRHIQHHAGQLAERIRERLDQGVAWVGGK